MDENQITIQELLSIQAETLKILEEQRKAIGDLLNHSIIFGKWVMNQEERIVRLEKILNIENKYVNE